MFGNKRYNKLNEKVFDMDIAICRLRALHRTVKEQQELIEQLIKFAGLDYKLPPLPERYTRTLVRIGGDSDE